MSNKQQPIHDLDWWLHEELLPPDPWAYIVSDFQWGKEILIQLEGFTYDNQNQKPIGHYPDIVPLFINNVTPTLNQTATPRKAQGFLENNNIRKSADF